MNRTAIYDLDRKRVCFLENAFGIGYSMEENALWTATFSLPASDEKNAYCLPMHYVELYDGDERVDLFRIKGEDLTRSETGVRTYACEHVLATLLSDVIFGYEQYGGTNCRTDDVIRYILAKQTATGSFAVQNWMLGTCAFSRQFEYNWENTNLLAALFSIPKCFDEPYVWTWDTASYPWRINLEAPDTTLRAEIRRGKNMRELRRTVDATKLANRIYALGYGEGVNQLNIKAVNSGVPYVEDADSIAAYGLCPTILVDRRFEHAENLKSYAESVLRESKEPYISYQVSALDLYRLTGDETSKFRPGYTIRILDGEDGIAVRTRVVKAEKRDLTGDPGDVQITIANKSKNVAGSISELQNRALINDLYAQGATNQQIYNFSDNADAEHPAKMLLFISDDVVRVNKMLLRVKFEPFRAFEKAASNSAQYSATAASGGGYSSTSGGGGGGTYTAASGGGSTATSASVSLPSSNISDDSQGGLNAANHNHGISSGVALPYYTWSNWDNAWVFAGYASWIPSGAHSHGAHSHSVTIPDHSHSVYLSDHTHYVTIPDHTHSVSIPAHSHSLEFGIYTGSTADAEQTTLRVDGGTAFTPTDWDNVDIRPWLGTDSSGKYTRGTWHTIEIIPNTMTRIVGAVFMQSFCSSRGDSAGEY